MVIVYEKATGNIVYTEDNRITPAIDSEARTKALEEDGLASVGVPYELGARALQYRVVTDENGEFAALQEKRAAESTEKEGE
ncbi:hypothetical protein AB1K91_18035 [Terribacillus sp. 179-K 1B1 HS]|uniref:hypothetical protein n=1 Tax=Terribacillus sp. 179-K 1B1 HS TaxID=3142388 RepID=UPI00399F86C0